MLFKKNIKYKPIKQNETETETETDTDTEIIDSLNDDIETYDYYKEISSLQKLSPICVTEEFEFGFYSLYSILSTLRVVILLIAVTNFCFRLDRLFNNKYIKYHWKYYISSITIPSIAFILLFVNYLNEVLLSLNVVLALFSLGYFIFYVLFLWIYFYCINDKLINKYGKVFTIKFYEWWFITGGGIMSISYVMLLNITRDSALFSAMPIPSYVWKVIGVILVVIGVLCKAAACYAIGFNTYFLYDMVLIIPNKYFTEESIYKYIANPMYGVGYLNYYGTALYNCSIWGLGCSVLCQCGIWIFYLLHEKPFIQKMYIDAKHDEDSLGISDIPE